MYTDFENRNMKREKEDCFDNELNLFGANIFERMKRFLFREKKKEKMLEDEWSGEGDCWIIQKPRILKAKHSPWTEYVSRFKSARGKEEWNGENKAMRAKWREFEDSPFWDSKAKLSILFRGKLCDIVIRTVVSLYWEKVKKKLIGAAKISIIIIRIWICVTFPDLEITNDF